MSTDNTNANKTLASTSNKELVLAPVTVRQQARRTKRATLRNTVNRVALWAERDLAPWLRYDLAPWLGRRGREIRDALTDGWTLTEPWIKAVVLGVLAALVYPALALIVRLAFGTADAVAHLAAHAHHTGIAATILGPLNTYITAHTAGLPVTADTVGWLWEAAGLITWFLAAFGSTIARLLWLGFGAATAAMVWSASPDPGRPVATAITVTIWAAASLIALIGLRLRPVLIVNAQPSVQVTAPPAPRATADGPARPKTATPPAQADHGAEPDVW